MRSAASVLKATMLFSSYAFLLVFLPATLAGFSLFRARSFAASRLWLLVCSALFYASWNPPYLALLAGSIGTNFLLGRWLYRLVPRSRSSRAVLVLGMIFNLGLLGYFKYASFLVENAGWLFGREWSLGPIVLPLAISFHTFQQLAFLVDASRERTPTGTLLDYSLFVLFFPQLIAGPIVHHHELIPQLRDSARVRLKWETAAAGLTLLVIGLVKKVAIADSLAPTANAAFDAAAAGTALSLHDAWLGTLAYTLQLSFDFSGYSDMAIGLARLFGIELPVNFNAPYQASSIGDFWRRWHITLSCFLRDYLYIPLGGSRCGAVRRSFNLLATMLLGGLWHGAGWTFVLWGALHGVLLAINHAWAAAAKRRGWNWTGSAWWRLARRVLTLTAVMAGWVLFRAADLHTAGRVLSHLCGLACATTSLPAMAGESLAGVLLLLAAVQFLPTSQALIAAGMESESRLPRWAGWLAWRPTAAHGVALSAAVLVCLTLLTRVREFLYFQF